jgi:hypothetical protein
MPTQIGFLTRRTFGIPLYGAPFSLLLNAQVAESRPWNQPAPHRPDRLCNARLSFPISDLEEFRLELNVSSDSGKRRQAKPPSGRCDLLPCGS